MRLITDLLHKKVKITTVSHHAHKDMINSIGFIRAISVNQYGDVKFLVELESGSLWQTDATFVQVLKT
jgi:hypothetical protein